MDRSRVELFGNRVITEQTLQSRYKTHIQRIKEIMNRKPGTSKTLNNRLAKANVKLVNVRYQFMREEFNDKAARENKALLKRIGKILTAPPTIGESSTYINKRVEFTGRQLAKEKAEISSKNKVIFERINKAPGYYHVKEWEDDYKQQLKTHKFVRQVFYTPKKEKPNGRGAMKPSVSPLIAESSSAEKVSPKKYSYTHIGRIRSIKQNNAINAQSNSSNDPTTQGRSNSCGNSPIKTQKYKEIYSIIEQGMIDGTSSNILASTIDEESDDEYDLDIDAVRRELASTERMIRILTQHNNVRPTDQTQPMGRMDQQLMMSEGDVSCWLVNEDLLLIIATANSTSPNNSSSIKSDQDANSNNQENTAEMNGFIQAEADILISDLAAVKGYSKNELLENDMSLLIALAKEIVGTVDISIESNGAARLLLSLVPAAALTLVTAASQAVTICSNDSGSNAELHQFNMDDMIPHDVQVGLIRGNSAQNGDNTDHSVSQDDLANMITDNSAVIEIVRKVDVPILFYENTISPKAVLNKKQPLHNIQMSLNISLTNDHDIMHIKATASETSSVEHDYVPIVEKDQVFESQIGLPSIVQADAEMMLEYMNNIATCCMLHHNVTSGSSNLVVSVDGRSIVR